MLQIPNNINYLNNQQQTKFFNLFNVQQLIEEQKKIKQQFSQMFDIKTFLFPQTYSFTKIQ